MATRRRMARAFQVAFLSTALTSIGCSQGEDPPPQCTPGRVESCPCSGGRQGQQTCNSAGEFDACICEPGPNLDASVDAGADAGIDARVDAAADANVDGGLELDAASPDASDDGGSLDAGSSDVGGADGGDAASADVGNVDTGPYAVISSVQPYYEAFISCTGIVPQTTIIQNVGATISVPSGFSFFGEPVTEGFISTNGTIQFGGMTVSGMNVALPAPSFPNLIAANWAPYIASTPAVCRRTTSYDETYSWVDASPANKSGPAFSFAARLHRVGTIDISLMTGGAAGGTIGIQGDTSDEVVSFACGASCDASDFPVGTVLSFVPSGWSGAPDLEPILTAPLPSLYPDQPIPELTELRVRNHGDFPSTPVLWRLLIDQPVAVSAYGLSTPVDGTISTVAPGATAGLGTWFGVAPSFPAPGTYPAHLWLETGADDAILGNNILALQFQVIPFVGSISFTTTSVPNAAVGVPYTFQLTATGAPDISFEGSSTWLSVSPEGLLTGTLPSVGNYPINVRASNAPAYESASTTFVVIAE